MGANAQTSVPLFVANTVLTAAQQNISAATGVPVFATTVTRDAAFGGSNKVLAEGQLCYLESTDVVQQYNGSSWVTVGPATAQSVAIFNETQASGTEGGTFTSGSYVKRTLNTTVVNTITSCTLTSSVISLPAGTYQVMSFVPCFNVTNNKSRLRNTTASTDIAIGTSMYAPGGVVTSKVQTTFTLASTANIELQHRCSTTGTTNGFGVASGYSDSEVYSTIQITKTA